jgi:hypothetical protein
MIRHILFDGGGQSRAAAREPKGMACARHAHGKTHRAVILPMILNDSTRTLRNGGEICLR